MLFIWNNEPVVLLGDELLQRAKVSLKVIMKEIRVEGGGVLIECKGLEGEAAEIIVPPFLTKATCVPTRSIFATTKNP